MNDLRMDPNQRKNPSPFWAGFGRYREGTWYDGNPFTPGEDREHWFAGWCHALTEGKFPKPWWQSKFIWSALAEAALGGMLIFSPPEMLGSSPVPGAALIGHSMLVAFLRRMTKSPLN